MSGAFIFHDLGHIGKAFAALGAAAAFAKNIGHAAHICARRRSKLFVSYRITDADIHAGQPSSCN